MTSAQKALLRKARSYWNNGEPAPYDLAVELMGEGLDVNSLESHALEQYLNKQ
jgi:hypothetical protein